MLTMDGATGSLAIQSSTKKIPMFPSPCMEFESLGNLPLLSKLSSLLENPENQSNLDYKNKFEKAKTNLECSKHK